ncbi:MAG: hypothetical protein ACPG4N_07160 [Gammaproteobacteria bacterium]
MTNLTISIDDETLKQARIRALQENTSVNALVGQFITNYANEDKLRQERMATLQSLFDHADKHGIDRDGEKWDRDSLYEPRLSSIGHGTES